MDQQWLNVANLIAIVLQAAAIIAGGIWVLAQIKSTNESLTSTLLELKSTIKDMQLEHKQITRQQIEHDVRLRHVEESHKKCD